MLTLWHFQTPMMSSRNDGSASLQAVHTASTKSYPACHKSHSSSQHTSPVPDVRATSRTAAGCRLASKRSTVTDHVAGNHAFMLEQCDMSTEQGGRVCLRNGVAHL